MFVSRYYTVVSAKCHIAQSRVLLQWEIKNNVTCPQSNKAVLHCYKGWSTKLSYTVTKDHPLSCLTLLRRTIHLSCLALLQRTTHQAVLHWYKESSTQLSCKGVSIHDWLTFTPKRPHDTAQFLHNCLWYGEFTCGESSRAAQYVNSTWINLDLKFFRFYQIQT